MILSISTLTIIVSATFIITAICTWILASTRTTMRMQKQVSQAREEAATLHAQFTATQEALAQSRNVEQHLSQVFEGLSSRVLKDNSNMYLQQTREQLYGLINPLMHNMQNLEKHIQVIEQSREGAYSSLNTRISGLKDEIVNLHKASSDLKMSAENLNNALRSEHTTRGKWGEIQLRRIAEMSGMVSHIDFEEQIHIKNADASQRPDMIIRLPREGIIPVDAKAPMKAYLQACATQSPDEKRDFMEKHSRALKAHVDSLSNKRYWDQFTTAPQIVILFLPYESGLEASFEGDPQLLDKALDNKVIIAGPSTLYAFLKVISYGWMQVELSKNATKIAELSKELIERISTFHSHFSGIGKNLNTAVASFNKAVGSLQSRVMPTLEKIEDFRGGQKTLSHQEENLSIETTARE